MRAEASYRELRFILEPELLQVYVLVEATGDTPLTVQGWHHKTFPASTNCIEALASFIYESPLLWPLDAPPR